MSSDWLDLDYVDFRFEAIDKLDDEILDFMDELDSDDSEDDDSEDDDSLDWDNLNLLRWSLAPILKMITAERHFVQLANDFSDSDSKYRIQIQLYNFIRSDFIPAIEENLELFDEDFDEEYEYDTAKNLAERYIKTMKALLETYQEIYGN